MPEVLQETFVRFVPAKIYSKATGQEDKCEGEEIAGHFLLKRQGAKMVLWEIDEYLPSGYSRIRSIGPVTNEDYHCLVVRNFRCS